MYNDPYNRNPFNIKIVDDDMDDQLPDLEAEDFRRAEELYKQQQQQIYENKTEKEEKLKIADPDQYPEPKIVITPFTREIPPVVIRRIAKVIYYNIDGLIYGDAILITRQEAKNGMDCKQYVNDSWILTKAKQKISVAMRENVFGIHDRLRGGRFSVRYLKDVVTEEDEDMVLAIRYVSRENKDLHTINPDDCVYVDV